MLGRLLNTTIIDKPLSQLTLAEGIYIYGNFEERSGHFDPNDPLLSAMQFVEIIEDETTNKIAINGQVEFPYNDMGNLFSFAKNLESRPIYLDITGLTHSAWAPLMKIFLDLKRDLNIIYVEPREYTKSNNPIGGSFYDLSERTKGISPLPGFSSFSSETEDFIFVPILGFEGQRHSYVLESVQPAPKNIFPVVGVPGYRAEYPFYTYQGNRLPLQETKAWKNIRYSSASCPFELFDLLTELRNEYRDRNMKIALLGTKPHAIGAILYRLLNPADTELIYDHPVRSLKRSTGATIKHIFHVSDFFFNNQQYDKIVAGGRLR